MRFATPLGCALLVAASLAGASRDAAVPARVSGLDAQERTDGWRPLFDGRTLDGWRGFRADTPPAGWAAVDGMMVRQGSGGDIVTVEEFGDFELQLEWRISEGGNSGIFFHVARTGRETWESGPEMQLLDNARHVDGKNPLTSAGANYALHAPSRDVTRPVGAWNDVVLRVTGPRVEHWLNGTKVVEYELWSPAWEAAVKASKFSTMPAYGRARRGHIALQDHGDVVWFRNIRIRSL
jgi:hypothetical protein